MKHGVYELVRSSYGHGYGYVIGRHDPDGRRRTVCLVDTQADWRRFVAALKSGANEVAAVHAIDAH
jgi:hypothetical protein